MPRMILLGTGTGVPDADRTNTHMVWDGPGGPLLIDAGGSTYQRLLAAGIDPQQLTGMILTHSHCDHLNGLPGLLFSLRLAGRQEPFPVYGPAPALELAQRIVDAFNLEGYTPPMRWHQRHARPDDHTGRGLACPHGPDPA
jgi:ribonuclease Z